MVKEIGHSLREFKKPSIITPVLVTFEVLFECLIPAVIAELVNKIQRGYDLNEILIYGARAHRNGGAFAGVRRFVGRDVRVGVERACKKPAQGYVL